MTEHPQLPPQAHPQPGPQQPPSGMPPGYAPQPMTPTEERNLGMVAHLVPAILLPLSAGTLGFVGSLVIYLMYKDRGPFVRQHAANSLNVQIITAILLAISAVLAIIFIGILTYALVIVVATVIHVLGAVKANNGEWWTPPLTPQIVR